MSPTRSHIGSPPATPVSGPPRSSPEDSSGYALPLRQPTATRAEEVGRKAANLAILLQAGFPVPDGFVLTTKAFERFLTAGGLGPDCSPEAVLAANIPEDVENALLSAAASFGDASLAVRSSGVAEDLPGASFAGQYETVLDVRGADALGRAVRQCWASAFSARVAAYRAAHGLAGTFGMAVLVQRLVPAQAAGVAFTTNPVTGDRATSVVSAVRGLGERLVSGQATPDEWIVRAQQAVCQRGAEGAIQADQARAIAELARRVEAHFGPPQDIEWAIDGGSLWLLQARPITTLPSAGPELIPVPIEVPQGYWERDTFHEPVPISPFGRVMLTEQILKVFPAAFAEFGILIDRAEVAFIGGWMYRQHVPVGAPPAGRPSAPPRWLLRILMRLHPAIRRRTRAARQAIASDLPATVIRRWTDEWRPEHQKEIDRALAVDLGSLSDPELAAQLDHRIAVMRHPAHVMVAIAYWILLYELAKVCRELLGWDTAKMLTLLEGLSTTSTEPARQLAHLAQLARSKPPIRELLARVDETTPGRLADVDTEFARAFSNYVEVNGRRALRYDVIEPTLAEVPHLLLRLVADQLELGFSPDKAAQEALRRRSQAAAEARGLLASHTEADRERFERALARAREAYPALEERVWVTFSVQAAFLRYLALEIGRRLVDRGQLAAIDDVFFLEAPDARSALLAGADRRETARVAKGQRAWAMANPGPYSYGDSPPGEPPFDLLPSPARLVNQGVLWGLTQLFGEPPRAQGPRSVVGTPASGGRYTGTVRVVMGEHQFGKIRAGDVVVCPTTSPVWSVVFPSMGALVTDGGGILSHPAIIAREHGIPAVVGAGHATSVFTDGQRVTVDGHTGVVELADSKQEHGGMSMTKETEEFGRTETWGRSL